MHSNSIRCKTAIAEAFGRAAETYDQHAAFQRDVGQQLLAKMPQDLSGKTVLDLGCGTGYFSLQLLQRGASVVCFDLSDQMLAKAKLRCGEENVVYQQGDAENLPFENQQFDYVFSSLVLQWCDDLSVPLKEIKRVVKSGGCGFISTLLDGSLLELKQAWAKIDSYQHVNDFLSINQVKVALAQAECDFDPLDLAPITVWYPTAFALMRDLKGIGATHIEGRSAGLTHRRALAKMEQQYQTKRNQQGLLPATYQVCLGVIYL